MGPNLSWLLLLSFLLFPISSNPIPDYCPQQYCGGIRIQYPFGIIGPRHCYLPGFQLSCLHNHQHQHHPFLSNTHLRILSISNGELRVDSTPYIATDCAAGNRTLAQIALPPDGPFTISAASNRFVAVGCDTVAVVSDGTGSSTSGCVSLCASRESGGGGRGVCSGVGCCEAAIPKEGTRYLSLGAGNLFGYANVSDFGNCSYSFVVESGGFVLKEEDLKDFPRRASIAMRLEWAIGGEGDGCLGSGSGSGQCGENGYCVPSVRGRGYLCKCLQGFSGNPYLNGSNGCQGN